MAKKRRRFSDKTRRPTRSEPLSGNSTEAKTKIAEKYHWLAIVVLSAIVAAIFHFSVLNIPDLDSFYYIRLAWMYRTRGLFDVDFPWIQYSVIKNLSSCLWYGFGLFLIPFTYFEDLVIGIKLAGTFLTVVALSLYYWVIKRGELKMALLWPFLFFFSTPNVMSQFLMTRPQLISLALSPLLFSFLIGRFETVNGPESEDTRANVAPLFLTSFGLAWFHLNFVWLVALILAVITVIAWIVEKKLAWRPIAAVVTGALLGWLARPNALGAAKLLYIQVVQQLLEKQSGLRLLLGRENLPLSSADFVYSFIPFTSLWALAILIMAGFVISRVNAQSSAKRILLWSSLALSCVFFLLTLFVGRRSYNLWAEFGIIFIASVFTYVISSFSVRARKTVRNIAIGGIVGIFIFVASDSTSKTIANISRAGYPPDMLRSAALWLKENSQPGDVVFNVTWSHFSPLFFWNQQNYYVGGLDPIFQYAYDPKLYWKFHHIATSTVPQKTCAVAVCRNEVLEDTYDVLVRDFKAKYVVVGKQQRTAYQFFEKDARFDKKLETWREVVYLVK